MLLKDISTLKAIIITLDSITHFSPTLCHTALLHSIDCLDPAITSCPEHPVTVHKGDPCHDGLQRIVDW